MAALRSSIPTVLIPEENLPDLDEIDLNVKNALHFVAVSHMDQVLDTALCAADEKKKMAVGDNASPMPREEKASGAYIGQ